MEAGESQKGEAKFTRVTWESFYSKRYQTLFQSQSNAFISCVEDNFEIISLFSIVCISWLWQC